jgi:hypothetical protein
LNLSAAAAGNGSGYSRPVAEIFVGCIDDCIGRFQRDIALYKLEDCAGGKEN